MKFEFSAGGVVFKKDPSAGSGQEKIFILLGQHSQHHGWVFPKGLIGDKDHLKGELKEDTAVREVKEETGIDAEIVDNLSPVTYWYQWEGEKRKKTVYYYLMEHVSGDMHDRDREMEAVEWLPIDEIADRLTYKSDKDVWQVAQKLIVKK